jgi:hypothetical protein
MPITPPVPMHPELIAVAIGLAVCMLGLRLSFRGGGDREDDD